MAVLTEQEVTDRVLAVADGREFPEISDAELSTILARAKRYAVHAVSTAYEVGDTIITASTGGNGRMYRALTAGTSDTTAPDWPTAGLFGSRYADGSTLIWEDCGPKPPQQWDLGEAEQQALLLKADKCAKLVTANVDGNSRNYSDLAKAYQARANRRTGAWVA